MGIRGLTYNRFTRWRPANLDGKIVVDGNSVCFSLYKQNHVHGWYLGGSYKEFGDTLREFFEKFHEPIVIFDGTAAGFDQTKLEMVIKRKEADLRQHLYGFIGLSSVCEKIRRNNNPVFTDENVKSITPELTLHDVIDKTQEERSNLVLGVLKCCEKLTEADIHLTFHSLDDK